MSANPNASPPDAKLVIVEWQDSASGGSWCAAGDVKPNPRHIYSVGWVHSEDAEQVTLYPNASRWDGEMDRVLHDLTIPRGCIIRITVLRRARKRQ